MVYSLRWSILRLALVSWIVSSMLFGSVALASTSPSAAEPELVTQQSALQGYARFPMTFEPNTGQTLPTVRFLSRGAGYTLLLSPDEAVLTLDRAQTTRAERRSTKPGSHHGAPLGSRLVHAALHMTLVDASPQLTLEGIEELPGTINYFIGNNPRQWRV